jgi:hypothetical protein
VTQDTTDVHGNNNYIFDGIGSYAAGVPGYQFATAIDPTTTLPTTFPATEFTAFDNDWAPFVNGGASYVTLAANGNAGDTVGLALVSFSASNASAGTAFLNFLSGSAVTDDTGSAVTLSTPGGAIVVQLTNAVPEPSTIPLIAAVAGLGLFAGWKRRRRRAGAPSA